MEKRECTHNSFASNQRIFYSRKNLKNILQLKLFLLPILISFLILISFAPSDVLAFDDGKFWSSGSYPINWGYVTSGDTSFFEIHDKGLDGNGIFGEKLDVKLESKDKDGKLIENLNLLLTEKNDEGLFGIEKMVFTDGDYAFEITDKVTVSVIDNCTTSPFTVGNCDPNKPEKLLGSSGEAVLIVSDTDTSGITLDLIETGPDTGIFEGSFSFSTSSSDNTKSILKVSQGDVITVADQVSKALTNGLILGNPNRFSIKAEEFGFIETTATPYGTNIPITEKIDILEGSSGGRGTGGFKGPGLVRDSISSGASGCNECEPPTLGVNRNGQRLVDNGFSYNDNPVEVNLFYTPYPLVTVKVGEENKAVLKVYENSGPDNIEHIGIGFGLAKGELFSQSKATINLDRLLDGEYITSTYDPENVFENIKVISEVGSCGMNSDIQCRIFTIFHTFREPLNFNIVATYVWDINGNAWQNYYNHGIHIFGDSLNPPKTKQVAFGTKEMRGLFTLTQIDKLTDKWIDPLGNTYQHKGNDRFDKISTIPKEKVYDSFTMHGCNRMCNWFEEYKQNQELLAKKELEKLLDGKEILNEQKGYVPAPPYTKIPRSEDIDLQASMLDQIMKAKQIFNGFGVKNNF